MDAAGGSERVVSTASSDDALRASRGPEAEDQSLSPAIERLALELERGLSADERQILGWLSQRVPQRQIAEWLGVTHGAARVRVARLRARLAAAAIRYAHRTDAADRTELDWFFGRLGLPMGRPPASGGSAARYRRAVTKEEQGR